jgi:hypothetical protein
VPLDASRSRRRWSWPKRAIVAAISLVVAFLLWILLLNIALWTGFVAWAVTGNYKMSGIEIEYDSAYVLWPTVVHLENFELRIDAYRYQLELVIPKGELDMSLLALLARRFHAYSIKGEDVSAKFRFKGQPGKVSEERLATFPEIEGMVEPVRLYGPPNIPDFDKAFEVQLDHVDGNFVSLWIDELNFTPIDMHLEGGMRSRAGNLFAIDHARVEARSGDLYIGEEHLAQNWLATLDVEVMDYNPFLLSQRDVLRQLTVQFDANTDVVSLAAINPFLARKKLRLSEGKGPLEIGLDVQRGVLMADTELLYETEQLAGRRGDLRGTTGMRFAFGVAAIDHPPEARAAVQLHDLLLHKADGPKDTIVVEHLTGWIATSQTDLTAKEMEITGAEIDMPKAVVRDMGALSDISKKIALRKGSAEIGLHSKMAGEKRLSHEFKGKLKDVLVEMKESNARIRASGKLEIRAHSDTKLKAGKTDKLIVTVSDLAINSKNGYSKLAWVEIDRGTVSWKNNRMDARVKGQLDDLRPILTHIDDRKRLVERVPDLDLTAPFDFDVAIAREGKIMDIRIHRLQRPGLQIEGVVHRVDQRSRSAFRLVNAQLGITRDESKERNIDTGADEAWLQQNIKWARSLAKTKSDRKAAKSDQSKEDFDPSKYELGSEEDEPEKPDSAKEAERDEKAFDPKKYEVAPPPKKG